MATAQKFLVRQFLDTLPLPNNIGAAEYRALHELLTDLDSDDFDGNDLDVIESTLTELREWSEEVRKRLVKFRERTTPLTGEG